MTNVSHFFSTGGHFGILKLPETGPAIVMAPSIADRPFHLSAHDIEVHLRFAPKDGTVNPRYHAVQQLLWLRRLQMRPETVENPRLSDGGYHPRIWRGFYDPTNPLRTYCPIDPRHVYSQSFRQSVNAARSLFDGLEDLFRYVEPSPANEQTHSHKIRELLILACTELEACWRGVLRDNCLVTAPTRLSTQQFITLSKPLGLTEWLVALANYPEYTSISPFEGWSEAEPTKSLPWYDAYNGTKHDRESNFGDASLANLLRAMAALHVQLSAQWGPHIFDRLFEAIPSPFRLERQPIRSAGELYGPRINDDLSTEWRKVPLSEVKCIGSTNGPT